MKVGSTTFICYLSLLWFLISIIFALIVVHFSIYESNKSSRVQAEKELAEYKEILSGTYWWDSSRVWWEGDSSAVEFCDEFFTLNTLESSHILPCIPQSAPKTQRYKWVNVLWIDASFADDSVNLVEIGKLFREEWAIFHVTQSPGRFPGSGVIRSNSKFIFWGKKVLFIFYNERKKIQRYKRADIIWHIKKAFPEFDEVKVQTFFHYNKVLREEPFNSDIGRLMYYIWDCELPEHTFCSKELRKDGKYQAFTQQMITPELDFFFILPAHGYQENNTSTDGWPNRFLQWLFKSTNKQKAP